MDRLARGNVWRTSAGRNPRDGLDLHGITGEFDNLGLPVIVDALSYIDTTEIFARRYPAKEILNRLRKSHGRRIKPAAALDDKGNPCGFRLKINQPTVKTLRILAEMERAELLTLNRVDLATDFICATAGDTERLAKIVERQLVLLFGRSDYRVKVGETIYWNTSKPRAQRRRQKEIAVYHDRKSKAVNKKCVHVELRIFSAQGVQRAGINGCADAIDIDPSKLMQKQVRLMDYPDIGIIRKRVIGRAIRAFKKEDKKRRSNRPTDHDIKQRRITGLFDRMIENNAQWVKDHGKMRWLKPMKQQLPFPRTLTWIRPSHSLFRSPPQSHRTRQNDADVSLSLAEHARMTAQNQTRHE